MRFYSRCAGGSRPDTAHSLQRGGGTRKKKNEVVIVLVYTIAGGYGLADVRGTGGWSRCFLSRVQNDLVFNLHTHVDGVTVAFSQKILRIATIFRTRYISLCRIGKYFVRNLPEDFKIGRNLAKIGACWRGMPQESQIPKVANILLEAARIRYTTALSANEINHSAMESERSEFLQRSSVQPWSHCANALAAGTWRKRARHVKT